MQSELLQLYRYIKYCLYKFQGNVPKTSNPSIKDMQHDILLYLVEKKGIKEFNAGSKRFAYLLARYRPKYIFGAQYKRRAEQVLLDEEGNTIELGLSSFANGEQQYDIDLLDRTAKEKVIANSVYIANTRSIIVTYISGEKQEYGSIRNFCREIGCHESTVNIWIRKGMPTKLWVGREYKYKHIVKIEYMMISNPFAGSGTVIKNKISDSQWEKRKDKDDFDIEIENETSILAVHKESKEGWLIKIKNPKGSEFYIKRFEDRNK